MSSHPIAPADSRYPPGLFDLEVPPSIWASGEVPPGFPRVAVVGTRKCTRYGIDLAESFGAAIARAGWCVVSGLARGIDTAAHRGCLTVPGPAIAVLGSGVDVCYPRENSAIYEEILRTGGSIVSEYPPGTPPAKWRFPERNRIIAALSEAVVVVESGMVGGALITARLAAEIGRPVFAVPGDVDREASEGCNRLLRDGAHPVLGPADLIEELGLVVGPPKGADTASRIPAGGVMVEDLPELWSLPIGEALAELGRLELSGLVRRVGEYVLPA